MLLLDLIHSTEFYILMALAAAVVLGLCVRPSDKGAARTFLYGSTLITLGKTTDQGDKDRPAGVTFTCHDDGTVELRRYGLRGHVTSGGALSIAVNIVGFDVTVNERLTPAGHGLDEPVDVAVFTLDCLGRDYYHVRYVADHGLCVLTLHNRPGIVVSKPIDA